MIVAFRRHALLPLDDCLYALQPSIPHLTRSALHRCLQRHGISRLPDVEGDKPKRQKFRRYPSHWPAGDACIAERRVLPYRHRRSADCGSMRRVRKQSGGLFSRRLALSLCWHPLPGRALEMPERGPDSQVRRRPTRCNSGQKDCLGVPAAHAGSRALSGPHHSHRSSHWNAIGPRADGEGHSVRRAAPKPQHHLLTADAL